jgi:hypothetical protein
MRAEKQEMTRILREIDALIGATMKTGRMMRRSSVAMLEMPK